MASNLRWLERLDREEREITEQLDRDRFDGAPYNPKLWAELNRIAEERREAEETDWP